MSNTLPAILDVGCGRRKTAGALGIDFDPASGPDIVHDLDVFPWPVPDRSFDRIVCRHVLEHLHCPWKAMKEIERVSRPGAHIEIATPHYSSPDSWGDITHYMHYSLKTFEPYYQSSESEVGFDLVSVRLKFGHGLISLAARAAAGCFGLSFYEKYVCLILRARNMEIVLRRRATT
jgi:SAM-dependent methyltransferase